MTDDPSLLHRINALVDEERRLREAATPPGDASTRLRELEVQLDQLWDLLRQRRAKREFGDDPAEAHARPAGTVEGYEN
jgi:hypothetical protein